MAGILSGQHTRVVLVNGRTIILQEGGVNRSSSEINEDMMPEAFQDATDSSKLDDTSMEHVMDSEYGDDNLTVSEDEIREPFLAVIQDNQGESQTIQLTQEQAKALGIHFVTDNDVSMSHLSDLSMDNGISLNDMSQMVYSDGNDQNTNETMFKCEDMDDSLVMNDELEQTIDEPQESLETSSPLNNSGTVFNDISGNRQITLIPQMISGQMTFSVKLSDETEETEGQFDDVNISEVDPGKLNPVVTAPSSGIKFLDITSANRSKAQIPTTCYTSTFPTSVQSNNNRDAKTISVGSNLLTTKRSQVSYTTMPMRTAVTNIGNPLNAPMKLISTSNNRSLLQSSMNKSQSSSTSTRTTFATKTPITFSTPALKESTLSKPATQVSSAASKPADKSKPGLVNIGKYTNVMASEGRLLNVPTTKSPNMLASELTAALTKMPVTGINKSKPLGSSENPIQLVQQGQTFHSVQSLNQEQLKHIATILQRQHLEARPKKSTVYNAETNTRIIYRVVYPDDLDLKEAGKGRGRRGRPPKAKGALGRGAGAEPGASSDRPIPKQEVNDDNEEAKVKRVVARTRSGRVSRPPRHMVRDYKRLHRLDQAEPDLDDSDGGYSDYQTPEPDKEVAGATDEKPGELLSGLVSSKRKISSHFRCPTCQKIYLGHSRMSRHFEAFPDHETFQEPVEPEEQAPAPLVKTNGVMKTPGTRGRGKRRGFVGEPRQRVRLREALTSCPDEDIASIAGPVVVRALTLHDLLMLRVAEGGVATLCEELTTLASKLREVAPRILLPLDGASDKSEEIELKDESVCAFLGISSGRYSINNAALLPADTSPKLKRSKIDVEENADNSCPDVLSALTLVAKKPDVVQNENLDDLNISDFVNAPSESSTSLDDAQLISSLDRYQNDATKSEWGKEKLDQEVFDPDIALASIGDNNSARDTYQDAELRLSQSHELEDSTGGPSYDEDLALESEAGAVERALAAMGEGEQLDDNHLSQVSFDPGVSLMEEDEPEYRNNVNTSGSPYDPECELAAMGEGTREGEKEAASRTFPGLDVHLDESNSELDFEALSEEFNRNTSHES